MPKIWCRTSFSRPCANSADCAPPPPFVAGWPRQSAEDAFLVLGLIRGLPEAYRDTLILRLVEGMTGPEIAKVTGLTPDSVRVNLCRGMKLLREMAGGTESK